MTTIDLRPVNAPTKAKQWPVPILESELGEFIGYTHFALIEIRLSYWSCPQDPESYEACGILLPQGAFVSMKVLHVLKDASPYFQSTI